MWEPDYCDVDDLADYVRIDDDADDAQIQLAITAASRAIDYCTRRQFGVVANPEPRRYRPERDGLGSYVAYIDDLSTADGLLVDGVAAVSPELGPLNAAATGRPYTRLAVSSSSTVELTGMWGWPAVPDPIVQACLLQASRFLVRRDSPYGIAGSPSEGSETRLLARVDPDVMVILRRYLRRAVPR